jgi:hypothetical protein
METIARIASALAPPSRSSPWGGLLNGPSVTGGPRARELSPIWAAQRAYYCIPAQPHQSQLEPVRPSYLAPGEARPAAFESKRITEQSGLTARGANLTVADNLRGVCDARSCEPKREGDYSRVVEYTHDRLLRNQASNRDWDSDVLFEGRPIQVPQ